MFSKTLGSVATLLLFTFLGGTTGYNKYGRSCQDIGCLSTEVCVMAQDPCDGSSDACGSYPTCKRASDPGQETCQTKICSSGHYCKTVNGKPTCVNTASDNGPCDGHFAGYESAGVDTVNGHRTNGVNGDAADRGSQSANRNTNVNANVNPYANANAPPAQGHYPVNSATNVGYPPYPGSGTGSSGSNSGYNPGSSSGASGYPAYPSGQGSGNPSRTNLGYPPYPTQNRMPVPGQAGYPPSSYPSQPQPGYPQQNGYPGYPQQSGYPQQQYPGSHGQKYPTGQHTGYQSYPYSNRGHNYNLNSGYRKNDARTVAAGLSLTSLLLCTLVSISANYRS